MEYNKETNLLIADENKWLSINGEIFVKTMYLAKSLNPSDIDEVTDEYKIHQENIIEEALLREQNH